MSPQTSSQIDEVCLFTLRDTKSLQLNDENDPNSIVAPWIELHPPSLSPVIPPAVASVYAAHFADCEIHPKMSFSSFLR